MNSKISYSVIVTTLRVLATIILAVAIFFVVFLALADGPGPWWKILIIIIFKFLMIFIAFFLTWVIDRVWQGKFIGIKSNFLDVLRHEIKQ